MLHLSYSERYENKTPIDRYCILMFDEMSQSAYLSYSERYDRVEGLECVGNERSLNVADHALVFMLGGLYTRWKQAVAFYLVQSATKVNSLKECIREVITAVHDKTNFQIFSNRVRFRQ